MALCHWASSSLHFEIHKKKRPCKWAAFSIGALLGNLERFVYWDFERKRECISGFLYGGPREHSKSSLRAIWNFSKEKGSTDLIPDYGAQKTH